jgi:hypothetical protein
MIRELFLSGLTNNKEAGDVPLEPRQSTVDQTVYGMFEKAPKGL